MPQLAKAATLGLHAHFLAQEDSQMCDYSDMDSVQ